MRKAKILLRLTPDDYEELMTGYRVFVDDRCCNDAEYRECQEMLDRIEEVTLPQLFAEARREADENA